MHKAIALVKTKSHKTQYASFSTLPVPITLLIITQLSQYC